MSDLVAQQPDDVQALIQTPAWQAQDLGRPLPEAEHAVSVCLPRWQDVVGYEEADPAVIDKLQTGYPRFVVHRLIQEAVKRAAEFLEVEADQVWLYPTLATAKRCQAGLMQWGVGGGGSGGGGSESGSGVGIEFVDGVYAVVTPPGQQMIAGVTGDAMTVWQWGKKYWQHAGEGISSRCAQAWLDGHKPVSDAALLGVLQQRLAEQAGVEVDDVLIYPTGMAAIYAAYRAASQLKPKSPSAQFGFPYVDALKVQELLGVDRCHFFPTGDVTDLAHVLKTQGAISALFTELPSNPLLQCPDLVQLRALADEHAFALIVDDTIAGLPNADALKFADAVTMSLTKTFAGSGQVTGGALIVNRARNPEFYACLKKHGVDEDADESVHERVGELSHGIDQASCQSFGGFVHAADLQALELGSRDWQERMAQINQTAEKVAEFLRSHPLIARVYYPESTESPDLSVSPWRVDAGRGCLISFDLHNPKVNAPVFYDRLKISKGPNLGTSFSLCCPFTLLAHYNELDFVESCGVSRYLIRLSIGLETPNDLIARLNEALAGLV